MKRKSTLHKIFLGAVFCLVMQFSAIAQNSYESLPFNTPNFFGACDSLVTWNYVNNAWEVGTIFAFDIDANGYLQEWRWRDKDNKLLNDIKYTRNSLHNATLVESAFDFGGSIVAGKIDIAYDANDRIITETSQANYMNTWMNSQRFTYTHDANGNITKKVKESWETGTNSWDVKSQSEFTYDANNRVTGGKLSSYSSNTWIENNKYTFSYDANGNMISRLEETNVNIVPTWQNYRKESYMYDANNMKIRTLIEDYKNSAWVNNELDSNFADGSSINYVWDNNMWNLESKQACATVVTPTTPAAPSNLTVNGKKKKDEAKMELKWQDNSNNEQGFIIYRSRDNSNWATVDSVSANTIIFIDSMLAYETKYYYRVSAYNSTGTSDFSNTESSTTLAGISDLKNGIINLSVYPNPCSNVLTISAKVNQPENVAIIITDVAGKQLSNTASWKNGDNQFQISTSALANGIYFLSISSNHISYMQKIVISK
jgi:hypothetical protein